MRAVLMDARRLFGLIQNTSDVLTDYGGLVGSYIIATAVLSAFARQLSACVMALEFAESFEGLIYVSLLSTSVLLTLVLYRRYGKTHAYLTPALHTSTWCNLVAGLIKFARIYMTIGVWTKLLMLSILGTVSTVSFFSLKAATDTRWAGDMQPRQPAELPRMQDGEAVDDDAEADGEDDVDDDAEADGLVGEAKGG